jgi:nitroimidazol reductase NimA-like FMN-containing flavoprotein (pyridoxamine 5'-phosphate oxidase superfamily)
VKVTGPWSQAQIREFLEQAIIPLRLACRAPSGHPLLLSLWFVPEGDRLLCASLRTSHLVRCLERDPRCAFEVAADAPPYRGVRGRGSVRLEPARGEETLRAAIRRYLGNEDSRLARWLLSRSEREVAIRIEPDRLSSFDFTERMKPS